MPPRITKIKHPLGDTIETPLLVSSFSSKGSRFKESKKYGTQSEVPEIIKSVSDFITGSALISAFDLKYYLGSAKDLQKKYNLSPAILFIDSGGYETLEDYDLTEVLKHPIKSQTWNLEYYENELMKLPANIPAVIISYDNGKDKRLSLKKQIERATKLFDKHPKQLNDFLIKSSKKTDPELDFNEISDNLSLLKKFNIIGITEKELGSSLLQRIQNIELLRTELDKIGCLSPIHIFGNLDPITSVLYFLAGAEIFDGLTWQRYAFYNGMSLYKSNCNVFESRITQKDMLNDFTIMTQNIIYLQRLREEMKKSAISFLKDNDIKKAISSYQHINGNLDKIISSYNFSK